MPILFPNPPSPEYDSSSPCLCHPSLVNPNPVSVLLSDHLVQSQTHPPTHLPTTDPFPPQSRANPIRLSARSAQSPAVSAFLAESQSAPASGCPQSQTPTTVPGLSANRARVTTDIKGPGAPCATVRTRGWRAERRPAKRGAPCCELLDFKDGQGRPQRPVFINTGANAWILVVPTGAFLNFRAASQAGLNGCGRRALALAEGAGPVDGAVALLPVRRVPDLIHSSSASTQLARYLAFCIRFSASIRLASSFSNLSRRFLILIYERTLDPRLTAEAELEFAIHALDARASAEGWPRGAYTATLVHSWRAIIQVYVALAASDATPHVRSAIGPGEAYLSAELGPAAPLRYDLPARVS
ncbi:hypothetical protein HETIRDRAFT_449128 [Heterobasidion irregulare TC 32-1]|uniref:Uncharacterized protein n=1 Tax=Heterobasidion irregulare (strain TC 32-1) TaxID=747525 RepID=W4KLM9_HETIT|nr:uncharacterized protein HETIRDRAFT_449128 [Heterobasidion irregulare TC 32-1]ETW86260.1 hypothetical protein HETIRDRAFT_449128 [Heterobasidion irregulare TC 32-1]